MMICIHLVNSLLLSFFMVLSNTISIDKNIIWLSFSFQLKRNAQIQHLTAHNNAESNLVEKSTVFVTLGIP